MIDKTTLGITAEPEEVEAVLDEAGECRQRADGRDEVGAQGQHDRGAYRPARQSVGERLPLGGVRGDREQLLQLIDDDGGIDPDGTEPGGRIGEPCPLEPGSWPRCASSS